jgi:hypothetical protein
MKTKSKVNVKITEPKDQFHFQTCSGKFRMETNPNFPGDYFCITLFPKTFTSEMLVNVSGITKKQAKILAEFKKRQDKE